MSLAISLISSSCIPLVVTDGVPILIPLVTEGFLVSLGTVFLLTVILAFSRFFYTSSPVTPKEVKSQSIRGLSVPPDTSFIPQETSSSAKAAAFFTI